MKKKRKPLEQQAVCISNSTTVCFCKIKKNNKETNIIKKQKGDKEAKKKSDFAAADQGQSLATFRMTGSR